MSPPLNRTPFWAPIVVPTIVAAGVANPSAQGQAINTDDAKTMSANSKTETPPAATGPPATSPHSGITSTKSARVAGRRYQTTPQQDRVRDDRWDEVRRDAVGEILDVWLAGLGFLDCLDDLLERRVRTDLRRLNDEDTVLVNGGPDDLVALTFRRGRTRR